jgi:hypothetical protein
MWTGIITLVYEWSASNEYVVAVTSPSSSDFSMTLIIISTIIFLCVIAFVFIRRINKKEEIEYVYRKEEIEDEE